MNFDQMSEEELDTFIAQKQGVQAAPAQNFDQMSEEELDAFIEQKQPTTSSDRNVIDEAHPAIGNMDRFTAKAFMDPKGRKIALQAKYPNLQIELDADDEIIAKGKNEKDWRKLDPSSFELMDIADVGFDIASGGVETAAAIGGGIMGLPAGGVGALATGAASSGAAATGMDLLRQKLGQHFGSGQQEVDVGESLKQGAISAALTPLGGIGGKALSKGIGKASGEALERAAKMSDGTLLERLSAHVYKAAEGASATLAKDGALGAASQIAKKTFPNVAQMTSGVKAKDWDTYIRHLPEIEGMNEQDVIQMADETMGFLRTKSDDSLRSLQAKYEELKGSADTFDISEIMQDFKTTSEELNTLVKTKQVNPQNWEHMAAKEFDKIFRGKFMRGKELIDSNVGMTKMLELQKDMRRLKTYSQKLKQAAPQKGQNVYQVGDSIGKKADDAFNDIESQISEAFSGYEGLKKEYAVAKEAQEFLGDFEGAKALDALMSIDSKASGKIYKKNLIERLSKQYGGDFEKNARLARTHAQLKNPEWFPTTGTAVSTNRALSGGIGGMAGAAMGGMGALPVAAGIGAGMVLGGPKGMAAGARGVRNIGRAFESEALQSAPVKTLYRSGWNALQDRTQEELER